MRFASEEEMTKNIKKYFQIVPKNKTKIYEQFEGLAGIPDFLITKRMGKNVLVVSLELKLSNWKRAIAQAFKYNSFSNFSIVIMDESKVKSAEKNLEYFKKYNVGLCSFNTANELKMVYMPKATEPYSDYLTYKLSKKLELKRYSIYKQTCQIDNLEQLFSL